MKKKSEAKYQKIIDETVKLIAENGIAELSTTKVAKRAGIVQSNIYIYFKDKQDLIKNVYLNQVTKMSIYLNQKVDDEAPLKEKLIRYIEALYVFSMAYPIIITAIERIKEAPSVQLIVRENENGDQNQKIQQLLKQGISVGLLRNTHISILLSIVFSTIKNYSRSIQNKVYSSEEVPLSDVIEMIMAAILKPTG
ncbi:TetR/AcrR family transcriptional regulator [Sporolactobacillus pectinivorans]|uniref:TetR/AcrR family transcriptional regulator n=1 Tax=Sporolactobacillus pectinivorans TaxID=1591408 RepID=UPI000C2622DA|nr:TetR/AcrR family transcriptional regulator [Sporolactobacillus pectinivorans]